MAPYEKVAQLYGVDPQDSEAVTRFFEDLPALDLAEQGLVVDALLHDDLTHLRAFVRCIDAA